MKLDLFAGRGGVVGVAIVVGVEELVEPVEKVEVLLELAAQHPPIAQRMLQAEPVGQTVAKGKAVSPTSRLCRPRKP